MVPDQHAVDEEKRGVRKRQIVQPAEIELFDALGELVAECADRSSDEGKLARIRLRRKLREQRARRLEEVAVDDAVPGSQARVNGAPALELDAAAPRAQQEVGIRPGEGEASEARRQQGAVEQPRVGPAAQRLEGADLLAGGRDFAQGQRRVLRGVEHARTSTATLPQQAGPAPIIHDPASRERGELRG